MKKRLRLDVLLVERGLFETRAKAQAAVMAGQVLIDGRPAAKAGTPTSADAAVEIISPCPYISRGGLKLESALNHFPEIAVSGHIALDVGASTGGFTDCLLQRGAAKVYAVDVGTAQLHAKLKADARVVSRERLHAKDMDPLWFQPPASLAVVDVSFISLTQVLPFVLACLTPPYDVLALIKPQFEVGAKLAPGGVVEDPAVRLSAVGKVRGSLDSLKVREKGLFECPVHGPKGNHEFFIWIQS